MARNLPIAVRARSRSSQKGSSCDRGGESPGVERAAKALPVRLEGSSPFCVFPRRKATEYLGRE